uniref:ribose 5-phosphate isomerase B n=1 Tax=uncultured Draconibacterium sp. TaxID=1573823 RepID=UPI003216865E
MKRIFIANDHAGTQLKTEMNVFLKKLGYEVTNYGTDTEDPVDYPDYVHQVTGAVKDSKDVGILICGSAQGVAIAANKNRHIRAAVCWEPEVASLSRKHNDANVLCLPARFVTEQRANTIALVFLQTKFEGGRHMRRIEKIDQYII